MKKSYLMIAAAAMVMVSCADTYELRNDIKGESSPVKIDFASFAEKATRGNTKPTGTQYVLEDYHTTMAVYGTKKDKDSEVQLVFDNVKCTYVEDYDKTNNLTGEWSYSPARYWDKQSTYNFAAFAPAFANMKFVFNTGGKEIASSDGKFVSSGDYVVKGQNLMSDKGVKVAAEWNTGFNTASASGDIDIMIADYVPRAEGVTSRVDFIFRHTLAKLIVAIKAGSNAPASGEGYSVKVTSVKANNYKKQGAYDTNRWTVAIGSGDLSYEYIASGAAVASGDSKVKTNASADAILLSTDPTYFIESLVMPQNIGEDQEIELEYEITTQDNDDNKYFETFKRTVKVCDIFASGDATRYNEAFKYIITLTIKPEIITFDAGVYEWAHNASGDAVNADVE